MKLRKEELLENIQDQYKNALENEHTVLEPTEANALEVEKKRDEVRDEIFEESDKAAKELIEATATEDARTLKKAKNRAELAYLIKEAKEANKEYKISRSLEEGYRYVIEITDPVVHTEEEIVSEEQPVEEPAPVELHQEVCPECGQEPCVCEQDAVEMPAEEEMVEGKKEICPNCAEEVAKEEALTEELDSEDAIAVIQHVYPRLDLDKVDFLATTPNPLRFSLRLAGPYGPTYKQFKTVDGLKKFLLDYDLYKHGMTYDTKMPPQGWFTVSCDFYSNRGDERLWKIYDSKDKAIAEAKKLVSQSPDVIAQVYNTFDDAPYSVGLGFDGFFEGAKKVWSSESEQEPVAADKVVDDTVAEEKLDEAVEEPKEEHEFASFDEMVDFLAADEQEAIDGYELVLGKMDEEHAKEELAKILEEEKAHKEFLELLKTDPEASYVSPLCAVAEPEEEKPESEDTEAVEDTEEVKDVEEFVDECKEELKEEALDEESKNETKPSEVFKTLFEECDDCEKEEKLEEAPETDSLDIVEEEEKENIDEDPKDEKGFWTIVYKEMGDDVEKVEKYDDFDAVRADYEHMIEDTPDSYEYVVLQEVHTDWAGEEVVNELDSFFNEDTEIDLGVDDEFSW